MSSSPQTLRYVFYGGVEGSYQNYDGEDVQPERAAPQYGAAAFGYTEGQIITGYVALSGEALAVANSVPRGSEFSLSPGQSGLDFFFQLPNLGADGGFTEADINQTVSMTLGGQDAPLSSLRVPVGHAPYDALVTSGYTAIGSGMNGAEADGVWLPEHIKPLVASGTSGNDTLRGTAKYNILSGGDGNDTLFLKAGQGWLWGGTGDDYLKGGDKGDHLSGGYGNDKILGRGGNDLVRGGAGNDELRGEQGNDTILGGFGNDTVKGGSGNDDLSGQFGNDRIEANDGNDTIHAGHGDDRVSGGSGNDWIYGEAGSNILTGNSGHDRFFFTINDGGGANVVTDFKHGQDLIVVETGLFETYEQMLPYMAQVGSDTVITYGLGSQAATITLEHTRMAELRASDFIVAIPG